MHDSQWYTYCCHFIGLAIAFFDAYVFSSVLWKILSRNIHIPKYPARTARDCWYVSTKSSILCLQFLTDNSGKTGQDREQEEKLSPNLLAWRCDQANREFTGTNEIYVVVHNIPLEPRRTNIKVYTQKRKMAKWEHIYRLIVTLAPESHFSSSISWFVLFFLCVCVSVPSAHILSFVSNSLCDSCSRHFELSSRVAYHFGNIPFKCSLIACYYGAT